MPSPWALLLSAVLLLLAGAAIYALGQRGSLAIVLAPFTSSNANASSNASSAAGGNAAPNASGTATSPTAPHSPTQTPRPGSTPAASASPTPRGSPTPTPTATPVPPTLAVSPTTITLLACVADQTQFMVTNTGGQALTWSVSASVTGYQISPSSGSIDPGLKETVTVRNILQSGIVTVSASGARNAPQQVSITCSI